MKFNVSKSQFTTFGCDNRSSVSIRMNGLPKPWVLFRLLFECTLDFLSRPPTSSSQRITNRSFRFASPHLWNQLPVSFRQPCTKHTADDVKLSLIHLPTPSPLSPSITHSLFHSRSKLTFSINLFHHSLLASTGLHWTGLTLLNGFSFLVNFFFLGRAVD